MFDDAKWYVVHTYSGYENKVATNIEKIVENRKMQDQILEVRVPTETVVEVRDDKKKEVERKLYPGYVLVKLSVFYDTKTGELKMTDDTWYVIRNTRGVTGFVGPESKPIPLSEREVQALGVEVRSVVVNYEVGDLVTILVDPFADFSGTVELLDTEKNLVRVRISMMGREMPIDLELNQVEPVL